jgi:hypothetical protein
MKKTKSRSERHYSFEENGAKKASKTAAATRRLPGEGGELVRTHQKDKEAGNTLSDETGR